MVLGEHRVSAAASEYCEHMKLPELLGMMSLESPCLVFVLQPDELYFEEGDFLYISDTVSET